MLYDWSKFLLSYSIKKKCYLITFSSQLLRLALFLPKGRAKLVYGRVLLFTCLWFGWGLIRFSGIAGVWSGAVWLTAICKWYRLITSDIGLGLSSHPRQWLWLTIDSGYDLHWSLFCQKVLSENVWSNFPSTFCKRTSFQSAFFNEYQFSLGPVFIEHYMA